MCKYFEKQLWEFNSVIQKKCIAEKSLCDDISQKTTDQEGKLYSDSWIPTTGSDSSPEEHDILSTSFEQKNDCYHKEDKSFLVIDVLV